MALVSPEDNVHLRNLQEVRTRHHRRMITEGIARRIIEADAPVNYFADKSEFTEGTLLYPTRQNLGQVAIGHIWGMPETIFGSSNILPNEFGEAMKYCRDHPSADVVSLARLDALPNYGYKLTTITSGLQLNRSSSEEVIALDGIEPADTGALVEMLHELQGLYDSGVLEFLDEESLTNTTISRPGPVPLP